MVRIEVKRLPHGEGLPLPNYGTEGAAGLDIRSAEDVLVYPNQRVFIATGMAVAIPPGYELQVRPRSGMAINQGFTILNSPGTIDSDYRGEIKIIGFNTSNFNEIKIARGDRVAQLVLAETPKANMVLVDELSETVRGEGGYGSTGR